MQQLEAPRNEAALAALGVKQFGAIGIGHEYGPDGKVTAYLVPDDLNLSDYDAEVVAIGAPLLIAAATAACDAIAAQIVNDVTHQTAYTNAAGIVAANGGAAPTSDPFKSAFAALGASVGIADPATFAKVVSSISLASMQLATVLGTVKGSVAKAKAPADLAVALTAFEKALSALVASLNTSGLTAKIKAPDPIAILGINA